MKSFRASTATLIWTLLLGLAPSIAQANNIEAVPTAWRLEGYVWNHTVKLWYTGAPECTNGGLNGSALSQEDFDRLFSLVMASKIAARPVGVFYEGNGGNCEITSFYAQ
jgi:hypothetical protein